MYKKLMLFLFLICFIPQLSSRTYKEAETMLLGLKTKLQENYSTLLKESFLDLWDTSWLVYFNSNIAEGQIEKDPTMSLFFSSKTKKVIITMYKISSMFSYDCKFYKDFTMLLSKKDAEFKFNFRMISPSTMMSTDGSMILHRANS